MFVDVTYRMTTNEKGQLNAFGLTFLEIEENIFQDTHGYGNKLLFVEDVKGNVYRLVLGQCDEVSDAR